MAGNYDGTLKFDTKIDDSGFSAGIEKIGSFAAKGMKIVAGATVAATGAMAALGKSALDAYADYEQLTGGVETLFKTSADVVNEYAANAYKTAGMSANEYMETVTSFSAALISSLDGDTAKAAEVADRAITDMSDNANKMGSSMESIQNAYQGFAKQNYTMLDNLKLGYGGTKGEMERLLADAEAISGIHYDIESYADVVEAIHVIQTEMDITGTTAREAAETISGSVGMTKAAWSNLVVGIADDNADFDKLLDDFVDSATAAAENILPRVEVIIGGLGKLVEGMSGVLAQALIGFVDILPDIIAAGVSLVDTLVTAIADNADQLTDAALRIGLQFADAFVRIFPKLVDIGYKALISLIQGISSHIGDIASMAMQFLSELANVIIENAPLLIETAADLIAELIEYIAEDTDAFISKAIEVLMAIAQALLDNAPVIIDAIIEALPIILKALIDNIPLIIQAIATIGIQIIQYIPQIFNDLVMQLPQLIGMVVGAIIENAPLILSAFLELFLTAVQALDDAWDSLIIALDNTIDAIAEYFRIGFNSIKDFFGDVYDTISDAISSALRSVGNWGKDMVLEAVDTASNFFDGIAKFFGKIPGKIREALSNSISTVLDWGGNIVDKMLDIGKNIVQGIWDGIKNTAGWLKDKIFGWAEDFLGYIKSAFGIHSPSTVMRDSVGKYLAEGVGVGFTEELPDVADDARTALTSRKMLVGLSEAMPSATSDIISNSYSYTNTTVNNSSTTSGTSNITLNAQFVVGEEVVAEGVLDIVDDAIDERQGLKVTMKRRGVTT